MARLTDAELAEINAALDRAYDRTHPARYAEDVPSYGGHRGDDDIPYEFSDEAESAAELMQGEPPR